MQSRNIVALNLFPLEQQHFSFVVYRQPYKQETEPTLDKDDYLRSKLPMEDHSVDYAANYGDYWVSFEPVQGADEYVCSSTANQFVTGAYLHRLLLRTCRGKLQQGEYRLDERPFRKRRIEFVLRDYPEGQEIVWLEPYFLKAQQIFGFLADFEFHAVSRSINVRRVQQLSLSLDRNFRSNRNFYADRYRKLQDFISQFGDTIFPLVSPSGYVSVRTTLQALATERLPSRRYVFGGNNVAISQYTGVKSFGPVQEITDQPKIYFVYRDEDRLLALDLLRALRGLSFETFSGMEKMFHVDLSNANVGGLPVTSFAQDGLEDAIARLPKGDSDSKPMLIAVVPFANGEGDEATEQYYIAKHTLIRLGLPSQFVSQRQVRNRNDLKWGIANIGLQAFAKMGGYPWKVEPRNSKCLIVGLSQSHKLKNNRVEKYFAYSVLTESTGLYKDLRMLGTSTEAGSYIASFKANLKAIFEEYYQQYDKFVIHATFSIRGMELDSIVEVLDSLGGKTESEKSFIVMKFNDRNRFFGYDVGNNSLVPFESSFVRLSWNEYLVWFEGLQAGNATIKKRIGRPLHVEFLYPRSGLGIDEMRSYLHDAVSLSGANWRGFNAKSLPVSIYYAYLVARYYREFQDLGLEDIDLQAFRPWFL